MVNGIAVRKANHPVRIGDAVAAPQGAIRHTVQVSALGTRRGPATEARLLYQEAGDPVRLVEPTPAWSPLLEDCDTP